jgi:hypothetical protein
VKKTVIETQSFLTTARQAGLSDEFRAFIVETIADDPMMGDMMPGTGGAAKAGFPVAAKARAAVTGLFTTTAPTTYQCCCWWRSIKATEITSAKLSGMN